MDVDHDLPLRRECLFRGPDHVIRTVDR